MIFEAQFDLKNNQNFKSDKNLKKKKKQYIRIFQIGEKNYRLNKKKKMIFLMQ